MELVGSNLFFAFTLTLLAGLATGLGGLLALFVRQKSTLGLSIGLGFSAGVMIYVSFMEILPEAQESFAHFGAGPAHLFAVIAFFAGVGLTALIDRFVPGDVNPHELKGTREFIHIGAGDDGHVKRMALKRTGLFTALAIAIHNFPEGFATFAVAAVDPSLAIVIAVAIAIHNVPEGIAVSLPIYHATGSRKKGFYYAFASGLAEPLGAVAGFLILAPFLNETTLGLVFALIAGIMVYISFDELLPAAREYGNSHSTLGGLIGGMMLMAASLVLFDFF